jgi:CheY-like chemotaxis protein/HPt (histidine-containing phosphotransfer) domain-containing protein
VTVPATSRLTIVDDDLMSREVLTLLAEDAGFEVTAFERGEEALDWLAAPGTVPPDAVLTDMQMPGVSGDKLAILLRDACGAATRLLAMSGSPVPAWRIAAFDGFLLKPFSMDDVRALVDGATADSAADVDAESSEVLNRSIYDSFAQTMPSEQLRKLYAMSIDDADARIETMREALEAGDEDAYKRAAHSIKGGCGLVGAAELARLASTMEELGPQIVDKSVPLSEFLTASARLRRILDALQR